MQAYHSLSTPCYFTSVEGETRLKFIIFFSKTIYLHITFDALFRDFIRYLISRIPFSKWCRKLEYILVSLLISKFRTYLVNIVVRGPYVTNFKSSKITKTNTPRFCSINLNKIFSKTLKPFLSNPRPLFIRQIRAFDLRNVSF